MYDNIIDTSVATTTELKTNARIAEASTPMVLRLHPTAEEHSVSWKHDRYRRDS